MITLKELLATFDKIWLALYQCGATDYTSSWHNHNTVPAPDVENSLSHCVADYDLTTDDDGDLWLIIHLAD